MVFNRQLAEFVVTAIISIGAFIIGCIGMGGVLGNEEATRGYFLSLLTLVVGIWVKRPKFKNSEEDNGPVIEGPPGGNREAEGLV